jgi:hypothetical protein
MGETVHSGTESGTRPTNECSQMAACVRFDWRTLPGSGLGLAVVSSTLADEETAIANANANAIGRCTGGSEELTVRDASRSHRHGRVTCWNRRLGSKESNIQLPDFVPRHRVGPPSGVPPRKRTTHSTV